MGNIILVNPTLIFLAFSKKALIIWTNLMNYLENAKNTEVKWFN
jgi:hypothetical protein